MLTVDSIGGSPPASMSSTLVLLSSANLAATIQPAVPAPATIKSKVAPSAEPKGVYVHDGHFSRNKPTDETLL